MDRIPDVHLLFQWLVNTETNQHYSHYDILVPASENTLSARTARTLHLPATATFQPLLHPNDLHGASAKQALYTEHPSHSNNEQAQQQGEPLKPQAETPALANTPANGDVSDPQARPASPEKTEVANHPSAKATASTAEPAAQHHGEPLKPREP